MLNVTAINNAKPKEKQYKLADSGGLYLLVMPNGSKLWRLKYYYMTKEKLLSLGKYPTVGLADARKARDGAKEALAAGKDPSEARQDNRLSAALSDQDTFAAIANEWISNKTGDWSEHHAEVVKTRLEADVLPLLGHRPINAITAPETLEVIREIERRGANETACRQLQRVRQIFDYAIATGKRRDGLNPASSLLVALKGYKRGHFRAIGIDQTGEFLRKLRGNEARLYPQTQRATELMLLTFVRTGELIKAKKSEFDLDAGQWAIPAERMKMKRDHIVPLSRQAVAHLRAQFADSYGDYLFPGQNDYKKHMSNNTILYAVKRMGYKAETTVHGFRATARTAIREKLGYQSEIIEKQLAHKSSGPLGEAYDRTQFLPERKTMMQDWADYLDNLAA